MFMPRFLFSRSFIQLIFYKKRALLEPAEILYTAKFAEEFIALVYQKEAATV